MKLALQSDEEVAAVVAEGERRFRYGQTNRRTDQSSPFITPPRLKARHPLTKQILAMLPSIETDKWHAMNDVVEWRRLEGIRREAVSQIKEDTGSWIYVQFRIGQQTVQVIDIWDDDTPEPVVAQPSVTERAIAVAMDTFVTKLPDAQQEVVRLRFYQNLSIRDAAKKRGVEQETIRYLEKKARRNLLRDFIDQGWLTPDQGAVLGIRIDAND